MLELDVDLQAGMLRGSGGELPVDLAQEPVRKLLMKGKCGQPRPAGARPCRRQVRLQSRPLLPNARRITLSGPRGLGEREVPS